MQRVALPASSRATRAVAEVLGKGRVVLLHSRRGTGVTISHCTVDHVKARLPLIQPQLEVGTAAPWEILRPPLNVEDTVGSRSTYRCEDAEPGIDQIQVVPIRVDGVVVGEPRQALVRKGGICCRELGITVGRQIDRGEGLVVQGVGEWQRDGDHGIIAMIAGVRRTRYDAAADLSYRVLRRASRRARRCCRRRRCWTSLHACGR